MATFLNITTSGWFDTTLLLLFWVLVVWVVVTLAGGLWVHRERPTARR